MLEQHILVPSRRRFGRATQDDVFVAIRQLKPLGRQAFAG